MTAHAPNHKRLHVITWGCQMNVYDSGRMADVLAPLGYGPADAPDAADMVVLNTCHIREKASEKLFSELGRLRVLKREREAAGGRMVLAVAGCVAQAEGEEIVRRAKVDVVVGPQAYHNLPKLVADAAAGTPSLDTDMPALSKFGALPARRRVGSARREARTSWADAPVPGASENPPRCQFVARMSSVLPLRSSQPHKSSAPRAGAFRSSEAKLRSIVRLESARPLANRDQTR